MSATYTKLFSTITASTVWQEPHTTRIVWVTMLAMSDQFGRVFASIPGLANISRVSIEECEQAITRFLSEDKYSRTKLHDGRRIETTEGGWQLLNYDHYRQIRHEDDKRAADADRQRRRRERLKSTSRAVTNQRDSHKMSQEVTEVAQAEAEVKVEKKKTAGFEYTKDFEMAWGLYPERSGDNPKKASFECWNARLKEGIQPEAMVAGVKRYAAFCHAADNVGSVYVMQAKRFFGRERTFEQPWSCPRQPAPPALKTHPTIASKDIFT